MAQVSGKIPGTTAHHPSRTSARAKTSQAIEYAARAGYAAKGFVYGTIGLLATMTAFGFAGGNITGARGAIETLRSQPFGQVVLWALIVGLAGYVVWRLLQAFMDPENKGSDAKGIVKRVGLAVSGVLYGALAWFAVRLAIGDGGAGASSGDGSQQSTAMLMQHEWGIWLVGLIGLIWIGVAAYQGYRAYSTEFKDGWKTAEMSPNTVKWATRLSRFGIAARAVGFALIGWFFVQASLQADPSEARGLSGALQSFYDSPYGQFWLALIGLGFVCYGFYCVVNARYRRIGSRGAWSTRAV